MCFAISVIWKLPLPRGNICLLCSGLNVEVFCFHIIYIPESVRTEQNKGSKIIVCSATAHSCECHRRRLPPICKLFSPHSKVVPKPVSALTTASAQTETPTSSHTHTLGPLPPCLSPPHVCSHKTYPCVTNPGPLTRSWHSLTGHCPDSLLPPESGSSRLATAQKRSCRQQLLTTILLWRSLHAATHCMI